MKKLLFLLAVALLLPVAANAATIVASYNFNDQTLTDGSGNGYNGVLAHGAMGYCTSSA